MKWLLLAFQLLSSHRALTQSRQFMEKAKDVGEKSKKMAFFSFMTLLFLVYFIAGSILIAINIGTQIDAGYGVGWTGMLWAGSGLILFGLLMLTIGAIVLKFPTDDDEEEEKKKLVAHNQPRDLPELLNQLAVTFVSQLVKSLTEKVDQSLKPTATPPAQQQHQQQNKV